MKPVGVYDLHYQQNWVYVIFICLKKKEQHIFVHSHPLLTPVDRSDCKNLINNISLSKVFRRFSVQSVEYSISQQWKQKTLCRTISLAVLYHTVPHELHSDEQHSWIWFQELSLITFSWNLELVLHAPFTNKGILNIWFWKKTQPDILLVSSYKKGVQT